MKYVRPYKIVNLSLLLLVVVITYYAKNKLGISCPENQTIECLYEYKYALLQPIYSGAVILAFTLAALLLVPSDLFRKWLWYIFPLSLILTVYWVSQVSVYSSSVLSTTRGAAAELSMQFFALVALLYILAHLAYSWWKKGKRTAA